jgi:hypothetical protein
MNIYGSLTLKKVKRWRESEARAKERVVFFGGFHLLLAGFCSKGSFLYVIDVLEFDVFHRKTQLFADFFKINF